MEEAMTKDIFLGCIDEAHQPIFGNPIAKRYGHISKHTGRLLHLIIEDFKREAQRSTF